MFENNERVCTFFFYFYFVSSLIFKFKHDIRAIDVLRVCE